MAWCMRRWTCEPCRLFIVSRCVRIPCAAATSTASSVPVRAAPTCLTTRWCKFVSSGVCDLPPAHPPPPQRHVAQARGCKGLCDLDYLEDGLGADVEGHGSVGPLHQPRIGLPLVPLPVPPPNHVLRLIHTPVPSRPQKLAAVPMHGICACRQRHNFRCTESNAIGGH